MLINLITLHKLCHLRRLSPFLIKILLDGIQINISSRSNIQYFMLFALKL